MRMQFIRGASVLAVAAIGLALSAPSVGATAPNGPQPGPKHLGGDVIAQVTQAAHNANATRQSSDVQVDNQQKNVNVPWSLFSIGTGSWSDLCGCDHDAGTGVEQSNAAVNPAWSIVANGTVQSIDQTADAVAEGSDGDGSGPHPDGPPVWHGPDDRSQTDDGCGCEPPKPPEPPKPDHGCGCDDGHAPDGGDTVAVVDQAAGNSNATEQHSDAGVTNEQDNWSSPISIATVGSGGGHDACGCEHDDGSGGVDQSNVAVNDAGLVTVNGTDQAIAQAATATASGGSDGAHESKPTWHPGCGCDGGGQPAGGGDTVAAVGQHGVNDNSTQQDSSATVDNTQTNVNLPITLFSVGSGGGDVEQGNAAHNTAGSATINGTDQSVDQTGTATANGGSGHGSDTAAVVEQSAANENRTQQQSSAAVTNGQLNLNAPITLFSVGSGGGDVEQGNAAHNTAGSATINGTDQSVDQTGTATANGGSGHGSDTAAIVEQAAANGNHTQQQSAASVDNQQTNVNLPITLFSVGSGNGDVQQSNVAANSASSGTFNGTSQGITQVGSAVTGLLGG